MVWFFERNQESMRLITAYDNDTKEFVATVMWSHGRDDQTRFASLDAFRNWLTSLEDSLAREHWRSTGPPVLLPDGWPDERLERS